MVWFLSEKSDGKYVSSPEKGNFWKKLNTFPESIYFKNENNIFLISTYSDGEINDTILCKNSKIDGPKNFQIFEKTNESRTIRNIDISISKIGAAEKLTGQKENKRFFTIYPFYLDNEAKLIGSLEIEEDKYEEIKRKLFIGSKASIIFSFTGPLLKADNPIGANASNTDEIFLEENIAYKASYFSIIMQNRPS